MGVVKRFERYKLFYDVIYTMGSYLGQNFLIDSKVRTYIAEHIQRMYQDGGCEALIEIGPGKGAITKLITSISDNFFVIEKDDSLIQNLECIVPNGTIVQGDVLEVDVENLLESGTLPTGRQVGHQESGRKTDTKKTLVVGNLPYYITSPILRKFFGEGRQDYAGGLFMLQDEVGQKLRHDAKKKSYLWRLINYAYEVTYLKGVPAKAFKPVPKIKSCLVSLSSKYQVSSIKWEEFIQFLELYASFSRKTLGAIQTMLLKKSDSPFSIPENLKKKRLEELSFDDLISIIK